MGGSLSRALLYIGELLVKFTGFDKSRRDRIWLKNPKLRKLVPKSRCPQCHHRLEPKYDDSSSSEDELVATCYHTPGPPHTSLSKMNNAVKVQDTLEDEAAGSSTVVTIVDKFIKDEDNNLGSPKEPSPPIPLPIPTIKLAEAEAVQAVVVSSADEFNFNQGYPDGQGICTSRDVLNDNKPTTPFNNTLSLVKPSLSNNGGDDLDTIPNTTTTIPRKRVTIVPPSASV